MPSNGIINKILQSTRGKQFLSLFSVNILGLPLSLLTSIVVTKYLGAELYGDFKFINSVFNIAIIICNLGFFYAANRAIVICNNRAEIRGYYGAIIIITVILSLIMTLGLIIYGLLDNNIDNKQLLKPFLYAVPFGIVYLVSHCYETLLQADNQIKLLSLARLLPKLGYLGASALLLWYANSWNINKLLAILYIYIFTQLVVYLYVIYKLSPTFTSLKSNINYIYECHKSYGRDVYIGSLFAVGFASLTDVLISYFSVDNVGVGFYSLAVTFALPLSMVPATMATTHYKDFAKQKKISVKLILLTVLLSFCAMLCLWIVVPPFIKYFYGAEFLPVIKLNYLVCFGMIMHGMADFFNRFIAAKGKGLLLRNASFVVGFATLGINLLLIPSFGATGAAYTKILSGLVYLIVILVCYIKVKNK